MSQEKKTDQRVKSRLNEDLSDAFAFEGDEYVDLDSEEPTVVTVGKSTGRDSKKK